MFLSAIFLIFSLMLILLAAEGFTNGVEVLGRRFSFSQAVVGSVLAAVGTALPETILPMVAIFLGKGEASKEIGVGAILGAPFMLSTIAFFLVGTTVLLSRGKKKDHDEVRVEERTLRRDLIFFISMYSLAIFLPLVAGRKIDVFIACALLVGYAIYVKRTVDSDSAAIEHYGGLHLFTLKNKIRRSKGGAPHITLVFFQIVLALGVMVWGAHVFVKSLEYISLRLGMSPLLFALILAPIATELPEKFNSVTWTLKGKDTLAMGNITGAMVFQATFPVSIGLIFTPWKVDGMALFSAILALVSASVLLAALVAKKRVSAFVLVTGGFFYFLYAVTLVFMHK